MCNSNSLMTLAMATLLSSLPVGAMAQSSDAGEKSLSSLEEIVVTARRREENLQDVPVSIQAFTGGDLDMRGLERVEDVVAAAPNVMVSASSNSALSTFAMRGIPRAGFFVDDVWQQNNVSLAQRSVMELERVEILRGPQGTLYGRDTTGGAIRLYTKKPSEEFGVRAHATLGNYDRRDISLFADMPISDTLFSKISVSSAQRDGYVDSIVIDRSFGDLDDQTIRGDLLWEPTENFSMRLFVEDSQFEGSSANVIRYMYDPGEPGVDAGYIDPEGRSIFWVPNSQYYELVGVPFNCKTDVMGCPGGQVGDLQNRSPSEGPGIVLDLQAYNLEFNWDITENIGMRSLTNYHTQYSWDYSNFVPSTVQFFTQGDVREREGWTQEFQFSGDHGRISWVAGFYTWDEEMDRQFMRWALWEFATGELDFNDVRNSPECQSWEPSSGLTPCIQVPPSQNSLYHTEESGYSIFGEVTFDVTDRFAVTVGARYHDQTNKDYTGLFGPNTARRTDVPGQRPAGDPLADITWTDELKNKFNQDTYRLALTYDWNDNLMTYAGLSQGYNAGGVSRVQIFDLDNNAITFDHPYDPEKIDNYEFGLRSDWLGGTLRFNATLFYTEWDDIQIAGTVTNPFTGVVLPTYMTSNAASAEAKGVEFEVTWVPNATWKFNLDLGLLDTKYTDIAEGSELSLDSQFGMAPEMQLSFGGQYNGTLANNMDYALRLDYMWTDGYNRTYVPGDWSTRYTGGKYEQPSFGLVNARVILYPADTWEIAVFGTNLTDERYTDGGFMSPLLQVDDGTVGRPREYGVSVRYEWR